MHTRADLLDELETVTDVLAADHRELAECLVAERQAKVHAFDASLETTVAGRNHSGDLQALDMIIDILRLKGKIAGHEARIAYITTALPYLTDGGHSAG